MVRRENVEKTGGSETIGGGEPKQVSQEQLRIVFAQLKQIRWAPTCGNAELRQLAVKHEVPKPLQAKFDTATKSMQKSTKEALGVFADLNKHVSHDKAAEVKSCIKQGTKGVADDRSGVQEHDGLRRGQSKYGGGMGTLHHKIAG